LNPQLLAPVRTANGEELFAGKDDAIRAAKVGRAGSSWRKRSASIAIR
jgi:hypothetical protein